MWFHDRNGQLRSIPTNWTDAAGIDSFVVVAEVPPYVDRIMSKPPKPRELRAILGELMARSIDEQGTATMQIGGR